MIVRRISAFRLLAAGAFACVLYVIAAARPALAMTELCPADAVDISPVATPMGTAAREYSYALAAQTPRSVDVALIADTNRGWFAWNAPSVALEKSAVPAVGPLEAASGHIAESSPLAVAFPMPLVVNHAWVVHVRSNGTNHADLDCNVPAFPTASIISVTSPNGRPLPVPSPLPSPQTAPAVAKPASAPFAAMSCSNPFEPARVMEAARPELPPSARDRGLGTVDSYIEVVLDANGALLDSWTYRSAGWGPIDAAALRAARNSTYSGAVSYCQPVKSAYLFRAQFIAR